MPRKEPLYPHVPKSRLMAGKYLEVGGLVTVKDVKTGELKRYEDNRGRPLAIMEEGRLTLTELGKKQGYLVRDSKLVGEVKA